MAEIQKDTQGSREDTLRFLDLVGLFSTQAMIGLGKIANPATGKAEKQLPAARAFIDMLEMLQRKTTGNLSPDETRLLQSTLTDLRVMFVEESNAPAEKPKEPAKPQEKSPAPDEKPETPRTD